jgi:hypothetical protein
VLGEGGGNRSLANVLPNARYLTIKAQTHVLKPKAHAPILLEFFNDQIGGSRENRMGSVQW